MSEPLLLAVFKAAHDYSAEWRYLGEVTCVSNCAMILFCGGRSNELCFNHHLADNRRAPEDDGGFSWEKTDLVELLKKLIC